MGACKSKPKNENDKMGGGARQSKKKQDEKSLYDPNFHTTREAVAAWHRYGVDVEDVFEIVELLGHGLMGEVYKVKRKTERRGVHNVSTRQVAEDKSGAAETKKKKKDKKQRSSGRADEQKQTPAAPRSILKPSSYHPTPQILEDLFDDSDDNSSEEGRKAFEEEEEQQQGATGVKFQTASSEPGQKEEAEPQPGAAGVKLQSGSSSNVSSEDSTKLGGGEDATKLDGGDRSTMVVPRRTVRIQRLYACKTLLTSHVKSGQMEELLNEIYIMRALDHPYILKLYSVYQVKRKLWLITELCTGGDLTSRKLNEPEVAVVAEQILRALAYMHLRGVCHRDIKLENIMYEHGGSNATIRLIDFGLSQLFDRGEKGRKAVGSAYTMSPEIASGTGTHTEKTDIWAVGVVVWVLLSGDFPFVRQPEELKDKEKLNRLINANYYFGITWKGRGVTKYAQTFVARCLKKDPDGRWTAKEALEYVQSSWIPALEAAGYTSPKKRTGTEVVETSGINLEDIDRFCNYGLMKKTILMTMANTMDRKAAGRLRDIFLSVDTENTGTINLLELKHAFQQINPDVDDDTVERLFKGIDQDSSGQIHYAEFLAAVAESQGLLTMDRLADAFDRIDTEGKGYISHQDLKAILGKDYNKEMVDRMIEEADFKKNGQVDYEELLRLMFENPETGLEAAGDVRFANVDD